MMNNTNHPFDWRNNNGSLNNKDLLKKIEFLISNEEFEEARSFLDIFIPNDEDPFKKDMIARLDRIIQDCDPEDQRRSEDYYSYQFDGTDVRPYIALDRKLQSGEATNAQKRALFAFWSAYPKHKDHAYCIKMFNWILENDGICCSDLVSYIISKTKSRQAACFYFLLARDRGYFDDVRSLIEFYEKDFAPEFLYGAELEYKCYKQTKIIPDKYSLETESN